jgi:hypothetical protein
MAAAADRHPGDLLDRVSPELVLVDAALAEEMRRRLAVPDDTLERLGRERVEPRPSLHLAELGVADEAEAEESPPAGGEPLPPPASAREPAHEEGGIEDLIVLPEEDPPSVPAALLVASEEEVTRRVAVPAEETLAARVSAPEDAIVVPIEDRAKPRGSYPALPSPSSDAGEEDATAVVLRQIRNRLEPEAPAKRRRRRLLSVVSLFAALSSLAMFAVDLQLGVYELPHWLPS